MRPSLILFSAFALAGVVVSHLLVEQHVAVHFAGQGDTGLCAALEGFSCAEAARSPWSTLGNLPIAVLGQAFYLTFLVMALIAGLKRERMRGLDGVFLGGSLLAVGYSALLAVASLSGGFLCPYCLTLYGVNLGLLVTALVGHPEKVGAAFRQLFRAVGTPAFWSAAGLMLVAVLVTQGLYANRAEAESQRRRLAAAAATVDAPAVAEVDPGDRPAQGPADAPVVVVEFSDFECPYCRRLADNLTEARKLYPDVRVHFRHFPMDQACNPAIERPFHQNACLAAYATECAERHGRFWELHDRLFAHNRDLSRPKLLEHARAVGLDVEAFDQCLDDPAIHAAVRRDVEAGLALGVQGTPTFFVNGHRQVGALPPDRLADLFRQQAQEKEAGAAAPANVAAP